ncbi:MAG TPA: hypothetical protein VGM05_30435 [Planctomycetaceae bacterium]
MNLRRLLTALACLVPLWGLGCGDAAASRPKLVAVKGKVVYNGEPVAGAVVAFHAENAPRPSSGTTDANGHFELTMFDSGDGAMVGDNVVTIAKQAPAATTVAPGQNASASLQMYDKMYKQKQAGEDPQKGLIPDKYADPKTSPQKNHVVATGPNDFTIELKD